MSVTVVPHLNFRGEARRALEFYQTVFGGDLTIMTYGDAGGIQSDGDASGQSMEAERDLVMWGQVAADSGFKVMAFDAPAKFPFERGQNAFYVATRFDTTEEAEAAWAALKSEANIRRELGPAPWAPIYGMLQDKFGVVWVLDVGLQNNAS